MGGALTPSLSQPVKFSGLRTCEEYSSFNTFTFSAMRFGVVSRASTKKKTKRVKGDDELMLNVLRCQLTY